MMLNIKFIITILLLNGTHGMAKMNWEELNNEQQKILLPFQSSWDSLDNEAKEKLMANTNRWLEMTPAERFVSREKLNRYKNLSQEERTKLQQKYKKFKNLTPQERRQLEQAKRKFLHLSPKEKARLRKKYQQLSPAHRKKAIQQFNQKRKQKEFVRKFDIEKRGPIVQMFQTLDKADRFKFRKAMKNMSPKQRHEQVLTLLELSADERSGYIQQLKQ